jgi:hypothetical protein
MEKEQDETMKEERDEEAMMVEEERDTEEVFHQDKHAPVTVHGNRFALSNVRSPGRLFCCGGSINWHPTHATVDVVDSAERYLWSARAHRKLRYAPALGQQQRHRWVFLGWEPRIVSWYIAWIGTIANTLWVVNGLYATWPGAAESGDLAEHISFGTGVVGAFLFIVTGYLGYVEAINQTYSPIRVVDEPKHPASKRRFRRPVIIYGKWPHHPLSRLTDHIDAPTLLEQGFPIVKDVTSSLIVTGALFDRYLQANPSQADQSGVRGRKLDICIGTHVLHVTVDELVAVQPLIKEHPDDEHPIKSPSSSYRWWTSSPDVRHMGIAAAVAFFVSTILFFIPACAWLPMGNKDASVGETIFWVQVMQVREQTYNPRLVCCKWTTNNSCWPFFLCACTQIIPCIGFIFAGHVWIAEASGSWWRPDVSNIGWWISVLNTVGGYGFMAYAVLAIPIITDGDSFGQLTKWGADLGTFWGSCAFWVAGILQCIEFGSEHS